MPSSGASSMVGIRWWHSPALLVVFFVIPFFLLIAVATRPVIENAPVLASHQVYLTGILLLKALFLLGGLALGAHCTGTIQPKKVLRLENTSLDFLFWFTFLAYVIWFGPLLASNPGLVLATLSGTAGAMYEVRSTAQNISGVTTLSQFGIAYAVVYGMKVFQDREKLPRRYTIMLVVILGLGLFRAATFSERIAIIEVVVPFFAIYVSSRKPRHTPVDFVLKFFPFFLYAVAPLFFALFEYLRSWVNHYAAIYDTFPHFIADRFALYYVTSLNNICALIQLSPNPTFRGEWTLNWLYRFPVIGSLMPSSSLRGEDVWFSQFLTIYATPEYNNTTGVLTVAYDWGMVLGMALIFVYGALAGLAFASFRSGRGAGRYFYPIFLYSLLEILRIGYIYDGRAISAMIGLIIVTLIWYKRSPRVSVGGSVR